MKRFYSSRSSRRFAISFCLLLLCGCSTSNRLGTEADDTWPYLGWDTNTPSLAPVTNAVPDRTYK